MDNLSLDISQIIMDFLTILKPLVLILFKSIGQNLFIFLKTILNSNIPLLLAQFTFMHSRLPQPLVNYYTIYPYIFFAFSFSDTSVSILY